jgi:hypothetical protein
MPRLRDGPRVPEWRVLPDTERRVGAHRGRCLGRGPYWIDPDAGIRPVNARQRRPGGDPAGGRTRCRPGSRQSDDHSRSSCSYADPRESLSDIAIAILPDAGWLSPERRPPGGCRIRLTTMCVRGRRWYYVPMDIDRNATSAIGRPPVALSICMVRDRGDDIMYILRECLRSLHVTNHSTGASFHCPPHQESRVVPSQYRPVFYRATRVVAAITWGLCSRIKALIRGHRPKFDVLGARLPRYGG